MNYQDNLVGEIALPVDAPAWMIQLANSIAHVDGLQALKGLQQITELVKNATRPHAMAQAFELARSFELRPEDVFAGRAAAVERSAPARAKFRDPATGKTWSGRGSPPAWIKGKDRSQFEV